MFYTASALLVERGYRARGHGTIQRAFGKYFVRTGEFDPSFHQGLLDAHDTRLAGDFNANLRLAADDVRGAIQQAQKFVLAARQYLARAAPRRPASSRPRPS